MKLLQKKERTKTASKSSLCQNDTVIITQNEEKDKKSQMSEIIKHLKKYGKITSLEANRKYGASRLSGIIWVLRKRGYWIHTERVKGKNRYGNSNNFAIYHLVRDIEEDEQ